MPTPIIEVENLTFRYDKRLETETLSDVSFTIEKGEWVAVVGNNGSGKSTLAKTLVGLLVPQSGRISIAGQELNDESKWDLRRRIGMVFQNPDNQFIGTTVQDDVAFSLENLNMPYDEMKVRIDQALEVVGLSAFRSHDPSRLSGGQKQRVAIAGVLALKPDVLVLDEAFVMLDPMSRRELLTTLQQLNNTKEITIISITHDMNEAAAADRLLLMKAGQIVNSGSPKDVFMVEPELTPSFTEQLRRILMKRNREVPKEYMTEEEMVGWLWK
ncbi:energy-coupling factor transporter ATPase [Bacillus sp. V3B]|uniref:energy-coupling factor transporter ATPase n=1 Tax=Bacillus sp. V3B TaxID=2804915 RepID=UPI00210E4C40|nr:energy-coupling factor transporter ATPase [Bacillus sp. V3B]MCQ6274512.1 energy-coupling factor transporter ATPase [Bacillus sp. V3B]